MVEQALSGALRNVDSFEQNLRLAGSASDVERELTSSPDSVQGGHIFRLSQVPNRALTG